MSEQPSIVMPMSCFATDEEIDRAIAWCEDTQGRFGMDVSLSLVPATYRLDPEDPLANDSVACASYCRSMSARTHVQNAIARNAATLVRFVDICYAPDVHAAEDALNGLGVPTFGQEYFEWCLQETNSQGWEPAKAMAELYQACLKDIGLDDDARTFLQEDTVRRQNIL